MVEGCGGGTEEEGGSVSGQLCGIVTQDYNRCCLIPRSDWYRVQTQYSSDIVHKSVYTVILEISVIFYNANIAKHFTHALFKNGIHLWLL